MLRSPVYMGKIYIPPYKNEPADLIPALHERIVTPGLLYEVQDILNGYKRYKPRVSFCQPDDLPLRGFLQCAKCGKTLSGSSSKGRNARYLYYHCTKGCKERFKAETANEAFCQVLHSISSNDKVYRSLQLILGNTYNKNNTSRADELKTLKAELNVYKSRLEKAQNLLLDGDLNVSDFQPIKSKLNLEIERLLEKVISIEGQTNSNEEDVLEFGFHFLANLDKAFTVADLEWKKKIVGSAFPEKLVFENNAFRTASEDNIFFLIANTGKGFRQKK